MKKRWLWAVITLLIVVVILLAIDEKSYVKEAVTFKDGNTQLFGSLTLPKTDAPKHPCIVIVGGAQGVPHGGYGYSDIYWNEFAKEGYSCLSWDKPGVEQSTGDWHTQSMTDRAREVLAAVDFLKQRNDIDASRIGLLGISQAGWVLPIAASMSCDIQFIVPISSAVDWISQGNYFEKNRLKLEGVTPQEIEKVLSYREKIDALLLKQASYKAYLQIAPQAPAEYGEPISLEDWEFYKKNINTNVKESLKTVNCPVLAIFGGNDAYVNVSQSMQTYKSVLAENNKQFTIKLYSEGNHSMLKSCSKHMVHKGFSMYRNMLKWQILGKDAFPDGYFNYIIHWTDQQIDNNTSP